MRYFDALLFCIANAFYQRNTAPLRLYKSLLLARPARAIGAKNTDDAPERPSDFTQYNFKAFTDSGEDSSSDNSDSATRLFQNEVRDRIYYINEHASYTSIKSTLDFIFKASETKHIPERFWYVALDATLKRKADLFAYQVFNHMLRINLPCTSHQLTSLLVLLSDKLTHEECLKCFDNALAVGLEPTVHNFSPLLKSCGGAQRAREILARMQLARIEPNVISFSAAIKSCEQVGDWQSSIELLELMRAYGVQPNEITFCCIISAASKGWASDIAVSILREMPMSGVPPNPLCYACTITACARCKNWEMVEKLFEEMAYLDMPIQESIIISVINCCRPSVRAPIRSTSSSNQVGATDEWAKALWIVNRWAGKVECLTESLYTIAMDVCFEAGKYKQVIDLYFNVLPRHYTGSTKSSLSFALKACEKMKDADTALLLLKSALEKGLCTNSMSGSVIVFCTSLGRLDVALQAFLAAYADELEDETKFMPLTNTRRFARDLLNYFATSSPNGSFKSLSPKSEEQLFQGLFRIVVSTFRGNKMVLENDDYERFITLLLKRKDLASLRTFISKSLNTPLSRNSQPMYEHMVQSLFLNIEPILAVELILSISEELHNAMRSRSANAIILHTMGFIYNNLTSSQLEGGLVENFVPTIGSTDRHQDKEESSRHRKYAPCVKERLVWRIFQKGRAMNGGKENLPIRCYRIAALACRDADLTQEMFELYMYSKQDNEFDRAVLSHAIYILSKSKQFWMYAMEIFGILRTTFKEPPDPYMYTSALVACENGKQAKLALSLLDSMVADGHGLNTYSVTTAIAACAASGRTDDALGLLTMMREKKIPCSVWTFNAAIFACANAGRWRDALTVFEIMRAYSEKEEAYLEVSTPPADASSKEDALHSRKRKSEAVLNSLEGDEVEEEDLFSMTEEDTLRVMQTTVLDLTPDLVLLSQDDGLNSVDSAKIPLNINCSKNHTSSGLKSMSYMEEENFLGSFQFANIVTVNTLIEALGEGEQFTLVDEVYLDAVKRNIISPLVKFEEGLVDLHFHSVHMANAALRYVFEVMLADDTALNAQGEVSKDIVVIIGKGSKLLKAVQAQFKNDFRPAIRTSVLDKNRGRLALSSKDVSYWLRTHKSLRGGNSIE